MRIQSLILALSLTLVLPALAPGYQVSLEASASKAEVAKGEGFTYKLSIIEEGQADQPAQLIPPDFTGFRVTGTFSSTSTRVIQNKARRVTDQEFRLSSDIPGERVIPPARLILMDPKTGSRQEMTSNPVKVVVTEKGPGILKGLEEDIRDIKSPKTFMDRVRLVFYAMVSIVVLVFFLLLGLALYMVRRRKNKAGTAPPGAAAGAGPISAREEALAALARAEQLRSDPKAYYSAVVEAVRQYLKAAHGIPAPEATTTEIMAEVSKAGLPQAAKDGLWSLLGEADLVKFAKHAPTEDEKARFIERARGLVKEI